MTARVQAPQRPREDSPPGASPPGGHASEPSLAAPPGPAAVAATRLSGPASVVTMRTAGEGDPASESDTGREPDDDVRVLELTASLLAPSQARHHAKATLARWNVPPEITRDSLTIVSELVTNAIAACGITPSQPDGPAPDDPQPVTLTLRRQSGQLAIEVTDPIPDPPAPAEPGLDAESGRGLMLVRALSAQWGFAPAAGGKTVFAVLALPA